MPAVISTMTDAELAEWESAQAAPREPTMADQIAAMLRDRANANGLLPLGTYRQVAMATGTSEHYVWEIAAQLGLRVGLTAEKTKRVDAILQREYAGGVPYGQLAAISKRVGCHRQWVRRRADVLGIPCRKKQDAPAHTEAS